MAELLGQYKGRYNMIVGFQPTGWNQAGGAKPGQPARQQARTGTGGAIGKRLQRGGTIVLYQLPYSEHSSFSELREFVQVGVAELPLCCCPGAVLRCKLRWQPVGAQRTRCPAQHSNQLARAASDPACLRLCVPTFGAACLKTRDAQWLRPISIIPSVGNDHGAATRRMLELLTGEAAGAQQQQQAAQGADIRQLFKRQHQAQAAAP